MNETETANPILATVTRGQEIESIHRGSAVAVNSQGKVVLAVGPVDRAVFPRSAYKFIQAIPLLESGAAEAFGLRSEEIALACASHNAESMHVERVERWLGLLGLSDEDLECGTARPMDRESDEKLLRAGISPGRRHHNCSGKHMGMLTLACHLEVPTRGYSDYHHPTQIAWRSVLGDLTNVDTESLAWERDGCGLPALCMPMDALAYGFARFAALDGVTGSCSSAMKIIQDSVRKHPEMVAGTGRCCTAVIRETGGKVLIKTGAEGVFCGMVPEYSLGFVLKVDDGAKRGSEVALGGLLTALGVLSETEERVLQPWFQPDVINSQGKITGRIEAAGSETWRH